MRLQLRVGEFLAARPVLLDLYQTQSLFQYPDLIFCESEAISINGQRTVELFE